MPSIIAASAKEVAECCRIRAGSFDALASALSNEKGRAMGRIVVSEFVSLDGVIEDPGGAEGYRHGGWSFQWERGEAGNQFKLDELFAAEAMLLGRVTYEGFAAAWPNMDDEQGFAAKMNSLPKYVVSKTLQDPTWHNTTVLSGDPVAEIAALKQRLAGDILVAGSASVAQLLQRNDLVDEYRLMVYPVLLGGGKRLFVQDDLDPVHRLEVVSAEREGQIELLVLRPVR
jgi:dihydrofolate reductase